MDDYILVRMLNLEGIRPDKFLGRSLGGEGKRIFGGQLIAQGLVAAQRTIDVGRSVHSLHAYFLHPGDVLLPIIYGVDRLSDGRSFSSRRVTAFQNELAIFTMNVSFQIVEKGLEHYAEMPANIPPPEKLLSQKQQIEIAGALIPGSVKEYWSVERPIEVRPLSIKQYLSRDAQIARQHLWLRAVGSIPADPEIEAAVLAYLTDMTILGVTTFPHGRAVLDDEFQSASLDHAIWFHQPGKPTDWLLYTQDSPAASGARGFARGLIHSKDGFLLASVAQEGLIRLREP